MKKRNQSENQLKNLKPLNELTETERRELAIKAGKKSAEVRRQKRTLREELELLLLSEDRQNKISLALIQKALKGDVKAFEVLRDTIGQKPKDVVENINPPTININGLNI